MGRSYLEVFFRHPFILMLPVVVGLVGGAVVGLSLPRDYVAGTTVWADARGAGGSAVEPPSAVESARLTQLLATRSFLEAVAAETPLGRELPGLAAEDRAPVLGQLASTISVSTPGPQVMAIAVKSDDAEMALSTAKAVLASYSSFQGDRLKARAQEQAKYDQQLLEEAAANLRGAEDRLEKYLAGRSGKSGDATSDPAASSLIAAAGVARQRYADASAAVAESAVSAADAGSARLDVIDAVDAALPQPRMKSVLMATVGGAAAGLVVSIVLLVLFMVGDRTLRDHGDAERVLGVPVVGSIPEIEDLAGSDLSGASAAGGRG